jgi:hypothetical protein
VVVDRLDEMSETGGRRGGNRSRQRQQRPPQKQRRDPPRRHVKKRQDTNHPKSSNRNSTEQAWLDAIHNASTIARPGNASKEFSANENQFELSLLYLQLLASTLTKESHLWDHPPTMPPPPPPVELDDTHQRDRFADEKETHFPPLVSPGYGGSDNNRFASFRDDDDEDEDKHEEYDHEAFNPTTPSAVSRASNAASGEGTISMRSLMIRVMTAQSEVYASQASPPQWKRGAELYQLCHEKITMALDLANSECALWLQKGDIPIPLQEDAMVVQVAVDHFTRQLDLFRGKAIREEERLAAKLEPQWQTRDEIRERWGEERWTRNPTPRRAFAEQRRADEERLREIRAALLKLNDMNTEQVVLSSQSLQEQVSSTSNSQAKRRYNGIRPRDLSKRVSLKDYPDPTNYGWTFTGSWKTVEFFQKNNDVKLDWYFTTATVKTSLHHPRQGKTQLFASKVSPELYIKILLNPRAHTNVRYQEKEKGDKQRKLWEPK